VTHELVKELFFKVIFWIVNKASVFFSNR